MDLAERRLFSELRARREGLCVSCRVVGGRAARRYASAIDARWYPARPNTMPRRVLRSADLVHLPGLDLPPPPKTPFVATVHDIGPLHYADETPFPEWMPAVIRGAQKLLTPSQFTADELTEHLGVDPSRIQVISSGAGQCGETGDSPLSGFELATLGLRTPLVLRVGGYTERKNVPLLLEAWAEVHRQTDACLALVGPPQDVRRTVLNKASTLQGVVACDYLSAIMVRRLMRTATLLVTTSVYEGFGLPPLEAMGAGTPVVAVRSRFVEEVCADAAVYSGNDDRALAQALIEVLVDTGLRERLAQRGLARASLFSWKKTADQVAAIYKEVGGSRDD